MSTTTAETRATETVIAKDKHHSPREDAILTVAMEAEQLGRGLKRLDASTLLLAMLGSLNRAIDCVGDNEDHAMVGLLGAGAAAVLYLERVEKRLDWKARLRTFKKPQESPAQSVLIAARHFQEILNGKEPANYVGSILDVVVHAHGG